MAARYILRRSGDQFYWNLYAPNGEVILSSERYTTKAAALGGIASCRAHSPHDHNYDRRVSTSRQPYFVLRAANNQIIGTSEMYTTEAARELGIASCKLHGPIAPTVDQTG